MLPSPLTSPERARTSHGGPALPLLSLDPNDPVPRFDHHKLRRDAEADTGKADDELEAILKDLHELEQDVLMSTYRTFTTLHKLQNEETKTVLHKIVEEEEREASTKSAIVTFLDQISSAISGLFGCAAPPATAPTALQPLLLVDPNTQSEKLDVVAVEEKQKKSQEDDLDELEAILRAVHELFQETTILIYLAYRSLSEKNEKELTEQLNAVTAREEELEREHVAIQTLLERLRAAFASFPTF
ncbi:hypothetical protein JCM8547_000516 [Rhodosporidiobolus lusitaniae]